MRPTLLAENERPDVTNASVRQSLSPRPYPYWKALAWGRYIGYSHPQFLETYWVAAIGERMACTGNSELARPMTRTKQMGVPISHTNRR